MYEVDIEVPEHWNDKVIMKAVEAACKYLGLTQRSRLYWVKRFVRWQIKMEKQKGSIEITYFASHQARLVRSAQKSLC